MILIQNGKDFLPDGGINEREDQGQPIERMLRGNGYSDKKST